MLDFDLIVLNANLTINNVAQKTVPPSCILFAQTLLSVTSSFLYLWFSCSLVCPFPDFVDVCSSGHTLLFLLSLSYGLQSVNTCCLLSVSIILSLYFQSV